MNDFSNLKSSEESRLNLTYLSHQFIGELHRGKGIPLSKAELGRRQLVQYLIKRNNGILESGQSINKKIPIKPQSDYAHLCPDRETLKLFLLELLHFLNPHIYKAVVCFEVIPDWLQFLVSQKLLDEKTYEKTLNNLRPLVADIRNHISSCENKNDFMLLQAVQDF